MAARRDENGRFLPGNGGGPGRPKKSDELILISIMDAVVTPERWAKIVQRAAEQAERGDAVARKWLSDNRFGQPTQRVEAQVANEVAVVELPAKVEGCA